MMSKNRKYWWKEMGLGLLLSIVIIALIEQFPKGYQTQLWGIVMTVILSIYIGFALKDQNTKLLMLQVVVAAFFLSLTLLGLWASSWFLVASFILHGFWDLLHDYKVIKTKVMPWYPDFCIVVDWLLGAWLAIELLTS